MTHPDRATGAVPGAAALEAACRAYDAVLRDAGVQAHTREHLRDLQAVIVALGARNDHVAGLYALADELEAESRRATACGADGAGLAYAAGRVRDHARATE